MIPKVIHRVAIGEVPAANQRWWDAFVAMHPGWTMLTHTPVPCLFPVTSLYWEMCKTPAQQSDLMRYEILYRDGGIYVDWDVEPYKNLAPFLGLQGFVACEDKDRAGSAIMGFEPEHPAMEEILLAAIENVRVGGHIMKGGPLAVTKACFGRDDVLILPAGTFYEMPWLDRLAANDGQYDRPWVYALHRCDASWMDFSPQQKKKRHWK